MSLHVLCPHCGTEFEVGNESNNCHESIPNDGTYFLVPKSTKFSNDMLTQFLTNIDNARVQNGHLIIPNENMNMDPFAEFDANHPEINLDELDDDSDEEDDNGLDEIEKSILNDGYIPNNQLWRRWIMAQMLRHYKNDIGESNFDKYFISGKPYKYQWDTILNEIKTLKNLSGHELTDRERFFNMDVIKSTARDYEKKLSRYIRRKAKVHIDKGFNRKHIKPADVNKHKYVRLPQLKSSKYTKVYLSDNAPITATDNITFTQLMRQVHNHVERINNCHNYNDMYWAVQGLMKNCPMKIPMAKAPAWKNAFKGAGAYYTMDNMIKFHGCNFVVSGHKVTTQQSLHMLENKTIEYRNEYYKLYALMQQFVEDNNFDFNEAMENKL